MASHDFVRLLLQIAVMLACALCFGQIMRALRQPPLLGEMIGGILLGPTIFGLFFPDAYAWLFASSPGVVAARDATIKVGMLFFLFAAGLEIDVAGFRQFGRSAAWIGLVGTIVPVAAGVALVNLLPRAFWGESVQPHFQAFALFVGMNLANSANPVLARILMDLGLLSTRIGSICMTASVVDDLVNWTLFAVVLTAFAPSASPSGAGAIGGSVSVVLLFVAIAAGGYRFGGPLVRRLGARAAGSTVPIAAAAVIVLAAASASEAVGIHAFLGAFLAGLALSGACKEDRDSQTVITRFSLGVFAPVYFISMGMTTDYITHFDPTLVAVVFGAAVVSKVGAVLLGARLAGLPTDRTTWAIACGLNARGATGIVLAGVGLSTGVIDDRLFVAMVVMCLLTSFIAAPAMGALVGVRRQIGPESLERAGHRLRPETSQGELRYGRPNS